MTRHYRVLGLMAAILALAADQGSKLLLLYGFVAMVWNAIRMPETLPESERRSLAPRDVLSAFRQTVTNRQTMGYALAAAGVMGSLFAYVLCSQQVFTGIYGLGHYFPIAFAA